MIWVSFMHFTSPNIVKINSYQLLDLLVWGYSEKQGVKIQPLFITVDPERDTPAALEKYIKEFSSKLIGLTGTIEQINSVCKKFRVYYSAGPRDADNDYIVSIFCRWQWGRLDWYIDNFFSLSFQVDHTIVLFLMDPAGEFVDYYSQNKKRKQIVDEVLVNIEKFKAKKWNIEE